MVSGLACGAVSAPGTRSAARLLEFGGELQPREGIVPEVLKHRADGPERMTTRAIIPVASVCARRDESRRGQCGELLRDGAEGDVGHGAVDRTGAHFLPPHHAQDFSAACRGDGGERGGSEGEGHDRQFSNN